MSKTIKQIAEELAVSKQSVYKRYKGKLYTVVAPYVHTVDGTVYIKEQGEMLIRQDFAKDTVSSGAETGVHTEHDGAHTEYTPNQIEILLNEIEWLKQELDNVKADNKQQLAVKDTQIKDLNNMLDKALNNQAQDNYIMAHQAKTLSDNSSDNNNKNVPLEQNGNNYNAKNFDNESISDEKQSWLERFVLFFKK